MTTYHHIADLPPLTPTWWFLLFVSVVSLLLYLSYTAIEVCLQVYSRPSTEDSKPQPCDASPLTAHADTALLHTTLCRTFWLIVCGVTLLPLLGSLSAARPAALLPIGLILLLFLWLNDLTVKLTQSFPRFTAARLRPLLTLMAVFIKNSRFMVREMQKHEDITMDDVESLLDKRQHTDTSYEDDALLKGIIRFKEETVAEIMTARVDIVALEVNQPYTAVLASIRDNNYSRIPVYDGNLDTIKGILYIKDLLPFLSAPATFCWQDKLRPALFVPETKRVDELLHEFQRNKIHIALVVDEFGSTSGLVSMEDILEEIVGDINDEYDAEYSPSAKLADNVYVYDAKTLIADFLRTLNMPEDYFETAQLQAESLGGLLTELYGEVPRPHQQITYHELHFEVLQADDRKIDKIKVQLLT